LLAIFPALKINGLWTIQDEKKAIQRKAQWYIDQIRQMIGAMPLPAETLKLRRLIRGYHHDPDLVFIQLWSPSGKLRVSWGKGIDWKKLRPHLAGKHQPLDATTGALWLPLKGPQKDLGVVSLGYSFQRLRLAQTNALLSLFLLGFAAALSVFFSFLFFSRLTSPLPKITQALLQLARGQIRQARLEIEGTDEIAQLAQGANEMHHRLQELLSMARSLAQGKLKIKLPAQGELAEAFGQMIAMLEEMSTKAKEITEGNLNVEFPSQGELAQTFGEMLDSLRHMATQFSETARQVSLSSAQILAASRQQEQGATEQSSAVKETQRTMETLLQSARKIATTSQGVLENAELTHSNNRLIAERINQLSSHMQRITETLEVIKGVANKSDLLALNASLEGPRAGEAGRGFSLVATQMQRLAENVMKSVADIKSLTADIRETTTATVMAIEVGAKLASSTTQSAREITLVTQQQQSGTEQVFQAMNEIADIAHQTLQGSQQATAVTEQLTRLADRLQQRVDTFRHQDEVR
jgi:methyl-accepting chemotaxis protein